MSSQKAEPQAKCLVSYYGVTNETCWYETDGERSEDNYVDALGPHLVRLQPTEFSNN